MSCAAQSFNNVNQNVWNCLIQKASEYGVTISGNSGTANSHGVTIKWNYDPGAASLVLQVLDKPFFITCSVANGKIHEVVEDCMGTHGVSLGEL